MNSLKYLLVAILAGQSIANAATDGGGGAGICVNNKCKTLAEAGFRLATQSGTIEVGLDVIQELMKIQNLLPGIISLNEIIGSPGDVQFVATGNPSTVKKFLTEYQRVLQANNGAQFAKNVEIFGFTVKNNRGYFNTFILFDQYNKLSVRGKALLLIHESLLRVQYWTPETSWKQRSLVEALEFDGAIVDYLNAKESSNWTEFDLWHFLKATMEASRMTNRYIIGDLIYRLDGIILEDLLIAEPHQYYTYEYYLSYTKILENNKYDSRFSTYVIPGKVSVDYLDENARLDILSKFAKSLILNPNSTVVYTKEKFDKFIKNYLENDPSKAKMFNFFKSCKKERGNRILLVANKKENGLHTPAAAVCGVGPSTSHTQIEPLWDYLNGLQLDIPGKLVCQYSSKNINPECHLEK